MQHSIRVGMGLLLLGVVLGMLAVPAWSQEVTAAIVGTVTDPSGAPIPGATVSVTDVDRGTQFVATTNESGAYNVPRIPVGNYQLKVSAKGFQTAVHQAFTLVLNQTARIDVPMKVGQVSETVEVSSSAPLLQTQSTEISTIIDAKTNASLPLASRNYIQLTLLAPGVTVVNPQALTQAQSMTSSGRPYINGNREQANSFLLDGVDNQENINNEVAYQPSVDAIQEFNLITQNASAEFGQYQGGIINTTIKSGSNSLHGSAFEFFRNDILNANSWQNGLTIGSTPNPLVQEPNGVGKKPTLRWNMFGATIGGPIVKNKLFFFADYQGQRFDHPQTTTRYQVFTDSERAGDFGQLCTEGGGTFDGAGNCTGKGTQLKNPTTGANIPFNNLAAAGFTISPVAAALFASNKYPHAQVNTAVADNFSGSVGNQLNNNQGDLKIDYNLSQSDHISGRYSQFHVSNPFTQTFTLGARANPDSSEQPGENLSFSWTHSFSPSLLNDFRVGINHVRFSSGFSDLGLGNFSQSLGIAGGNAQAPGLLGLDFANAGLNLGTPDIEQHFGDGTLQLSEGVIWTRGRHIIHAGFQYWRMRENSAYSGNDGVLGNLNFTSDQASFSDVGNFWLGNVSNGARQGAGQEWGMRGDTYAAYVQDDWRITSTLTLNVGLRYEDHTPWTEIHNRMVNFGLFSGAIEVAGQNGNSRALVNSYNGIGNYQPRIGLAWSPGFLGGKGVVRAAYSVSSYMEGMGSNLRMSQNRPFVPAVSAVSGTDVTTGFGPPAPLCSGANLACYDGVRIFPWDPNLRPANVQQWNLSVQQQLSNETTFQIGYVGQRGAHLVVPEIITQRILAAPGSCPQPPAPAAPVLCTGTPGPFFAGNPALRDEITGGTGTFTGLPAALATFSGANQAYNALQATLQKRFSNGLQGQVAYTYSKCMTDATGYFGGGWGGTQTSLPASFWQNIYDRKAEWGPCYFDQTHILSAYANYQLPFGHGKKMGANMNRVANAVVGGWEVSPIITLHSGNAMTAGLAFFDNSGTGGAGPFGFARPNCGAAPSYPKTHLTGSQTGIQWVDPGAFTVPSLNTFGDCHNGSVRGPTLAQVDVGVHKDFAISENKGLELRSEFINLFNHPILNAPNMLLGPTFGQITTGQGERNIQFALKFHF
jgi:Carboxypeptidase regulatory-like domain/TonB dependent receptor